MNEQFDDVKLISDLYSTPASSSQMTAPPAYFPAPMADFATSPQDPFFSQSSPAPHFEQESMSPPPIEEDPRPVISARFVRLPVVSVDQVNLIVGYFDSSDDASRGPQRIGDIEVRSAAGLIKSVVAEISFRSPVLVDHRSLIARTPRTTTLASRETLLDLGVIDTTGTLSHNSTGNSVDLRSFYSHTGELTLYTVRVPLIYDRFVQPRQMPLTDRIQTKDHYVLHYTISIPGVLWPSNAATDFKVRIKVVQTLPLAEVVSISRSFIDSPRFSEAWTNFKEWVSNGFKTRPVPHDHDATYLELELTQTPHDHYSSNVTEAPLIMASEDDRDHHLLHEYPLKLMDIGGQPPFSMPPPMPMAQALPTTDHQMPFQEHLGPASVSLYDQQAQKLYLDDTFFVQ